MDLTTPTNVDVCILGAGPHGLAATHHLQAADPKLRVAVIDRTTEWLANWHAAFAYAEIRTLRSPIVHHPSPDPSALATFMQRTNAERSGLRYDQPPTSSFTDFCSWLISSTNLPAPLALEVRSVRRIASGVHIATNEQSFLANHLVVATNPHRRNVPDWTWPLLGQRPGLVGYAQDIDLRCQDDLAGRSVAVVGGGLSAGHLAAGAAARGAHVHLITRSPLRVQTFDTDPGWLGPKFLDGFNRERNLERRLDIARFARGGGSIPEWMHDRLRELEAAGTLSIHEATTVDSADVTPDGTCALTLGDGCTTAVERVWLATGTSPDITAMACLSSLAEDVATVDGYPLVDESLRLGPHPAFVMGRLATTALGPAAGNLWGAQRAAQRITESITGVTLRGESIATVRRR